jgi:CheY-like chemotaxis protein
VTSEVTEERQAGGHERILLVDDEAPIAKVEKLMLESLGYRVTSRINSVEALEAFKANPHNFDVVVTDMTMPNMTGAQLAKELLAIRPDIRIIVCTGFSERIDGKKAAAMGIKGFLMKPILRSDLAKMVRDVLDETKSETQGQRGDV